MNRVAISDVVDLNPSKRTIADIDKTQPASFIGMSDVGEDGTVSFSEVGTIEDYWKGYTYFEREDILFAKITPCMENLKGGIVAELPTQVGFGSTEFHVFRPKKDIVDTQYLSFVLRSQGLRRAAAENMTGSAGQKRVPTSFFSTFQIPLPSFPEQRRIAARLDAADRLRQLDKALIEKYDELKRSLFLEMFGDPVHSSKYPTCRIDNFVSFKGGSQPAKIHFTYKDGPDVIRFIQIRDYRTDAYITYIPKTLAKRFCNPTDIMIGRYGPPVFQILRGIEGSYNVALMKTILSEKVLPEFAFELLSSDSVQNIVIGNSKRTSGQTGVNLKLLNSIEVGLPPLDVQQEFEARIVSLNRQQSLARAAEQRSEKLFLGVLGEVFG